MPGRPVLFLPLDDYLAQWLRHDQGCGEVIEFRQNSVEMTYLECFLQRGAADCAADGAGEGRVAVALPDFVGKRGREYCRLSEAGESALMSLIRRRFDLQLWQSVYRFASLVERKDDLIYAFMERHGIEPTERNWQAVAKRYDRMRTRYRSALRQKRSRSKVKKG